jgi:hypothetical protein
MALEYDGAGGMDNIAAMSTHCCAIYPAANDGLNWLNDARHSG